MGAICGFSGHYTWGFALLALAVLGGALLSVTVVRHEANAAGA